MINRETAISLAQKWFKERSSEFPHISEAAVDEKNVVEASFAWVLPWNGRRYLETGDFRYEIQGQQPLVVLKGDGTVMLLPSLTKSEYARWKSQGFHGTIEHRIANLAEKLGIKNA